MNLAKGIQLTEDEWIIWEKSRNSYDRPFTEEETRVKIKKDKIDEENDWKFEIWLRENDYIK